MLKVSGSTGTIGRHLPSTSVPVSVDLSNPKEIVSKPIFGKKDNFIHLAGIVGEAEVRKNADYSYQVNVVGTTLLAKKFIMESSGVFYFASTSHVYEKSLQPISEQAPINPMSEYAKQKYEAENKLIELFKAFPEKLCIVRIFSILDWEVSELSLGGAIRKLANKAQGFSLQNCDDVRDFLTPHRAAEVIYLMGSEGKISGIINLCSGQGISVGTAAARMLTCSGFEVPSHKFVAGESTNPFLVGDNRRLKSFYPKLELTWRPSRIH